MPDLSQNRTVSSTQSPLSRFEYCGEHSLPKPCVRCALLCPCGCDKLRDGVSEEVWEALKVIEPFVRQHAKRSERSRAA